MVTLTPRAQLVGPSFAGPTVIPSRARSRRRRASAGDLMALCVATALVVAQRVRAFLGPVPVLGTVLVVASSMVTGFLVVGVIAGTVHLPGTRTFASVASRLSAPFRSAESAYVPLPSGPAGAPARVPVVRQSQPGSDSPSGGDGPVPVGQSADAPTPEPTPRALPAPALPPPPPAARLRSVSHVWQTWNNCGPATVTMALSAIGRAESQPAAVAFLKTSADDKNVNPDELVEYARSRGVRADWRMGGDLPTLKRLIAAGVPVIVEVGFEPDLKDWMGHYRLLVGYDDAAGRFLAFDSYLAPGQNVPQPYGPFEANWRAFNRTFLPLYPADKAQEVARIVGAPDDPGQWERALARAVADAEAHPNESFAWFSVGTSLVRLDRMEEAVAAYDEARRLKLPWRMLWYQFGPFEAYLATGRISDVLTLANATLAQVADLEESQYYRGRALQSMGRNAEARTAYVQAIRANARFAPAHHFLSLLPR